MARTPIKPPSGVELSPLRTIRSCVNAHKYIDEVLDVPLSFNYVRAAAKQGEIPCRKLGHALYFSTQDLFDWVMSLSEKEAS
jgi:hypothetical protein